ncbi:M14 family zinc carboxypeptidase [Pedobacter sp.]|uniref:M14 family zinc carboxypeptidase n=1 Tax=Pedobacter sp. TaxID=1411316 RepID=UPI003D7F9C8E
MHKKLLLIPVFLISVLVFGLVRRPNASPIAIESTSIWQKYERYKEAALSSRMFKHSDIMPLLQKHIASGVFHSTVVGKSVQGKTLNLLTIGKGKTKVLLWSQMHGDESTATMALMDIFNFLSASDENDAFRKMLTDNLEINFLPMLNPDGAEAWKRRNGLDIDINRDARLLNTPEARVLTHVADSIKPSFGFNLHDQSTLYAAGATKNQATISFLAPAYNYVKDMNEVRQNATKLIVLMNRTLQKYAPEKVAKYNDAFDPRCFGDTFQGKGISTILIESGGYPNDPEKQYIRKLNFYVILSSLHAIAQKAYESEDLKAYMAIPDNNRSLYDLVIRNAEVTKGNSRFRAHVGINRSQIADLTNRSMSYRGYIEELGDMEKSYGYEEADASALISVPGKIKVMKKADWEQLSLAEELTLAGQGYLFVKFSDQKSPTGPLKNRLLNLSNSSTANMQAIGLGQSANFILSDGKKPVYAVINGFLVDFSKEVKVLSNAYGY